MGISRSAFNVAKLARAETLPHQRLAMDSLDLASLLCSRLCHDLMSPVGALNNGIELLADETDPEMREKCLELLAESARASANKLKFFRLAFGAGGGFGEEIDTHEAETALGGLFGAERRIELGWMVADKKLPKPAVKLLLNLALLAGDALVRGGRLDVGSERRDGEIELAVRAEGPRILLDPALRDMLEGQESDGQIEPRAAGAWLARKLVSDAGGSIRLSEPASEALLIGASLPLGGSSRLSGQAPR
jgi:histidine phosphotransferase ChpT